MKTIEEYRKGIKKIDLIILGALAKRFALTKKIGNLKKKTGEQIQDLQREEKIREYLNKSRKKLNLNKKFILSLWKPIIGESKRIQKN